MHAAFLGDERGKPARGDRVRHDGRARMLLQQHGGDQRDQAVSVELFAVVCDRARAIHIRVEDDAHVGFVVQHALRDGIHRRLVLRVWLVVGKMPVGFEELAARGVRAQRLQHAIHIKPARAVTRVHDDAKSLERMVVVFGVYPAADSLDQPRGIDREEIHLRARAALQGGDERVRLRAGENARDVALFQSAVFGEKLHAVAVPGQVARGEHDRAVELVTLGDGAHEHAGRARESEVRKVRAHGENAFRRGFEQRLAGEAGVAADGEPHFALARALLQKQHERLGDIRDSLRGQRNRLAFDAVHRDAADVASVLQLLILDTHTVPRFRNHVRPNRRTDARMRAYLIFIRIYCRIPSCVCQFVRADAARENRSFTPQKNMLFLIVENSGNAGFFLRGGSVCIARRPAGNERGIEHGYHANRTARRHLQPHPPRACTDGRDCAGRSRAGSRTAHGGSRPAA